MSELLLQIGVIIGWIAFVFLLGFGARHWYADPEIARKVVHIGMGHVILIAWLLRCSVYLCLAVATIFTLIAFLSYFTDILPMLNGVERQTRGVFYYALSITGLVAVFWTLEKPELGAIGVMVMCWGDGMAALIGKRWGKHKYQVGLNERSWEGSLAMLLVSLVVVGAILQWTGYPRAWLIALPVATVSTFLEAVSIGGTDNFTVPVGSTLVCLGLISLL